MRRPNRLSLGQGVPGADSHWNRKELLIDGRSLQEHLTRSTGSNIDCVSPLGCTDPEYERQYLGQLLLSAPALLPSGRQVLLVCPLCADLGCGCISARIEINDERTFWNEIGFENDYDPDSLTIYPFLSFVFDAAEYRIILSTNAVPDGRSHP